jgi:hypothetical protein
MVEDPVTVVGAGRAEDELGATHSPSASRAIANTGTTVTARTRRIWPKGLMLIVTKVLRFHRSLATWA